MNDLDSPSLIHHYYQLALSSVMISASAKDTRNMRLVICCWQVQHRGVAFFSFSCLLDIIHVMAVKHIIRLIAV